jgi:sugar/nucleoside kinase (ribokinase family)
MEQFNAYVEENAERFIEELKEFCRQPSISTKNVGLEEMAELVRARLERLGAEVRLIPVDDGPPVVFAKLGQGERTLLIYNHYDIQPPDSLWRSGRLGQVQDLPLPTHFECTLMRSAAFSTLAATTEESGAMSVWLSSRMKSIATSDDSSKRKEVAMWSCSMT